MGRTFSQYYRPITLWVESLVILCRLVLELQPAKVHFRRRYDRTNECIIVRCSLRLLWRNFLWDFYIPNFVPVKAVHDSNDSISGEFWGKRLNLRNGATYNHALCCWGPAHSTDIWITALECTCQCLCQNMAKFHSPTLSDTDPGRHLVILLSARISHGDKKWACGRGIMRLPENVKISEKVPSDKTQGASYNNTLICPIIPSSKNELKVPPTSGNIRVRH